VFEEKINMDSVWPSKPTIMDKLSMILTVEQFEISIYSKFYADQASVNKKISEKCSLPFHSSYEVFKTREDLDLLTMIKEHAQSKPPGHFTTEIPLELMDAQQGMNHPFPFLQLSIN